VETGPENVEAAQQAGELGYVFKICAARDLVAAVESAARGERFLSLMILRSHSICHPR
jgi:DNA-binding NarL/FixJ family response regulator